MKIEYRNAWHTRDHVALLVDMHTVHSTFVHHLEFDPTGSLLASCSSDKTVEVLYRKHGPGMGGTWEHGCTLRDHSGPVIRLAWCHHREHGPLLATAGADRWIYIYKITLSTQEGSTVMQYVRWSPVRGYEKDAVMDVAFVPPQQYHVLLLSTASLDGCVRLYEVHQPLQFPCICKLIPEAEWGSSAETELFDVSIVALRSSTSVRRGLHSNGLLSGASPRPEDAEGSVAARLRGGSQVSGGAAAPLKASAVVGGSSSAPATTRRGGITSIAWFPGAAESTMTLAVGSVAGRFYLYRYLKESHTFTSIDIQRTVGLIACASPIRDIEWAPVVGRGFQLVVICSCAEVFILRLNCISPSSEDAIDCELYRYPIGAVSASWSHTATLLYLVDDKREPTVTVLQMQDPTDHSSWREVAQYAAPHQNGAVHV